MPRTALWAAGGLTLLLLVMFPANVHLATTGTDLAWWDQPAPRTLLQLVFLAATATVLVDRARLRRRPAAAARAA